MLMDQRKPTKGIVTKRPVLTILFLISHFLFFIEMAKFFGICFRPVRGFVWRINEESNKKND